MNIIDLESVHQLTAGAIGEPGQRTFLIQAADSERTVTVLVEKEQVRIFAAEALALLDRLESEFPGFAPPVESIDKAGAEVSDLEPAFRARAIGIGFDTNRRLVLIELRERGPDDEEASDEDFVVRILATPAQVRVMAEGGTDAVGAGRPLCSLCSLPMDPEGHICPRWN